MRALSFILASFTIGQGFATWLGDESQKVLTPATPQQHGSDPAVIAATIREDAQSPAACAACEAILFQLKLAASRGDDFFVRVVTELCRRVGVQDDDVCEGTIALEGPIIAHSLRGITIGSRTSRLACVTFMGLCTYPEVEARNVSFPSPKPKSKRPSPSGLEPLRVVHFSDIHIDPFYVEGAEANCSKPICCRDYTNGDKPGNVAFPAGPNGEHTCDTPVSLEESMYAAIRETVPDAAFAIFTGDVVDHAVWDTSEPQNTAAIRDAYGRMARAGLPAVHGTAGNHEASPANSFPPTTAATNGTGSVVENPSQWLYDLLASTWARWNGDAAEATTREFGAYSTKYVSDEGRLGIISLSTNLYYAHNYWLYEEPMQNDPSGQLAWLVAELNDAETKGERVYIVGHMPFGARDAFHDASNQLDQIVNRYEATIAAMFFGHTHFDEFELSYTNHKNKTHTNAIAISYIAPSLTPTSGHPAFRVYEIDQATFAVLDATTFIANTSAPDYHSSPPKWTKYYSAREAYAPLVSKPGLQEKDELTPAFWHNVTEALERNVTAFDEFFHRRRRGWVVGECDAACRGTEICKLRAARARDNCMVPGFPGVRTEEEEEEECGGSVLRETLGWVVLDGGLLGELWGDYDGVVD